MFHSCELRTPLDRISQRWSQIWKDTKKQVRGDPRDADVSATKVKLEPNAEDAAEFNDKTSDHRWLGIGAIPGLRWQLGASPHWGDAWHALAAGLGIEADTSAAAWAFPSIGSLSRSAQTNFRST